MKNEQRKFLAAFAAVILFSSVAFADGDMPGGGIDQQDPPPVIKTIEHAPGEGDMPGGGLGQNPSTGGFDVDWLILTGRILGIIG